MPKVTKITAAEFEGKKQEATMSTPIADQSAPVEIATETAEPTTTDSAPASITKPLRPQYKLLLAEAALQNSALQAALAEAELQNAALNVAIEGLHQDLHVQSTMAAGGLRVQGNLNERILNLQEALYAAKQEADRLRREVADLNGELARVASATPAEHILAQLQVLLRAERMGEKEMLEMLEEIRVNFASDKNGTYEVSRKAGRLEVDACVMNDPKNRMLILVIKELGRADRSYILSEDRPRLPTRPESYRQPSGGIFTMLSGMGGDLPFNFSIDDLFKNR